MVQPNWGLLNQGGGFQNALTQGYQMGSDLRQRKEAREDRNALLSMRQQELDSRLGERQAAMAEKTQQRQQADTGQFRKLLKHAGSSPEGWQQAMSAAQSMGLDLARVPQQFDPQWAQTQLFILDAAESETGQQALSTAGKIAADMGFKPGTPEHAETTREIFLADAAKPYTGGQGETRLYIPQLSGGRPVAPQPGTVVGGFTFKGGNPNDRNAWEPVGQGGPSQPATGGFRP